MQWRFAVAGLLCIGAGPDPGAMLPFELGVLSCTLGHAIDPQISDQTAAASEAREMLCLFKPARVCGRSEEHQCRENAARQRGIAMEGARSGGHTCVAELIGLSGSM